MLGVEKLIMFINFEFVVKDKALPLVVLAEPDSEQLILQHSILVLKQSGHKPFTLFTKNIECFKQVSMLCSNQLQLKSSFFHQDTFWICLTCTNGSSLFRTG